MKDCPVFMVRKLSYANQPNSWRILKLAGFTDGKPSYRRLPRRFYSREEAAREVTAMEREVKP